MRGEYKQLAVVVRDALGSMNKDISDVVHGAIGYGVATKLGEMDAVNNDYNTYVAPVDKIGYVLSEIALDLDIPTYKSWVGKFYSFMTHKMSIADISAHVMTENTFNGLICINEFFSADEQANINRHIQLYRDILTLVLKNINLIATDAGVVTNG